MSLFDQAKEAAFGLAKEKLTRGVSGTVFNSADAFLRRAVNLSGNYGFNIRSTPGERDPLEAGRARPDPLMSFNWYCDLPVLDGIRLGWEFVEEATLPFVEFEQVGNYRAGKMYHYPGHHSIGTLSLKLYEDSQGSAARYLDRWRRKMIDLDSGLYYHPQEFKQTIKITVLDVTKITVMFVEYTGCWPMRSDTYALNSGSSDRIAPTVEFSVDEMRVKFGKFTQDQIPSIIDTVGADWPPQFTTLPVLFPGNFVDISISDLLYGDVVSGLF
jgi:hypothetical protein